MTKSLMLKTKRKTSNKTSLSVEKGNPPGKSIPARRYHDNAPVNDKKNARDESEEFDTDDEEVNIGDGSKLALEIGIGITETMLVKNRGGVMIRRTRFSIKIRGTDDRELDVGIRNLLSYTRKGFYKIK